MARQVAIAAPFGLVQIIHLRWDKSARGGQGACDRNAVPQAFPVAVTDLTDAGGFLCVDASHWSNDNAFAEPLSRSRSRVPVADGFRFGCVSVSGDTDGLQVRYEYDRGHGGAPDRWFFNCGSGYGQSPGRTLRVAVKDWVRICYNGRFACIESGDWWYEQATVNVAWCVGEPEARVFLAREPAQELRLLADLW
jgi:hypothetical protein